MKKFILVVIILVLSCGQGFAQDHGLWTQLLKTYVKDGQVNYSGICKDPTMTEYLAQLITTDPMLITERNAKFAFWINAYNAYTVKLICDHYPIKSINRLHKGGLVLGSVFGQTAWDKKIANIHGELLSLGFIEHKILRHEFKDARVHFAIVCAAKGCPPLRSEAYEAVRFDEQLNDQAQIFLSNLKKNSFDIQSQVANISPIFSWFKTDFGGRPDKVLSFLVQFLPENLQILIKADPSVWKIRYTDYDWSLNVQ